MFVFPPDDPAHTRKLRFFTPVTELPFAGHPTLGAAFVLASIGEVALDGASTSIVFEEGVGPIYGLVRTGARHAPTERFGFVRAHQAVYPVATMCRVLRVSPSGYYA